MLAKVECANCQRSFTRGGFSIPEDIVDNGFYVVVDECSRCKGK